MIKKTVMRAVKYFIAILPNGFKERVKSWHWLVDIYGRALRNSGMFYGYPTDKQIAKLYLNTIAHQESLISKFSLENNNDFNPSIVVIISESNLLEINETLSTLNNPHFGKINLLCPQELIELLMSSITVQCDVVIIESFVKLPDASSYFFLNSGEKIHADFKRVLRCKIENDTEVAYVDTDFYDKNNKRMFANFYPSWNPELQMSTGYIRTGVWLKDLASLHHAKIKKDSNKHFIIDLMFSLAVEDYSKPIQRIAFVLISRPLEARTQNDIFSRYAIEMLSDKAQVKLKSSGELSLLWDIKSNPLVSLIIPTKNAHQLVKDCIESILEKTDYLNFEIILVDNNSDDPISIKYFDELSSHSKIRLLKYPHSFNYSKINNFAVRQANGQIIGLINNDIEVIEKDWLSYMVGLVQKNSVGCVGAKLLYSDNRIQHGGVVLGYGGGAGHAHKYFPHNHAGYLNRLSSTNCFSAVTAACLLVKKADYDAVGGLDENNLTVAFNDVDLCLKVLGLGKRNVYCAEAKLFHHESVSRGLDTTPEKRKRFLSELHFLQSKWYSIIENDPCYNPNLTLSRENFAIKELASDKIKKV